MSEPQTISERVQSRDRRAVARAISLIENDAAEAPALLRGLAASLGRAYRVGITGPPGAGKSTLTSGLTKLIREAGMTVGIVAIDPTSPFTGGALLGDRIRMQDVAMDDGVFVRSMATRGSLGGLSAKAMDAADVLDAAGFDFILFETVGVGQSELDIAKAADTTIVVLVPESGDSVQAMKSGLMEIADFFVVNKSDRDGAFQAVRALQTILEFRVRRDSADWSPTVLQASATKGQGVGEILAEIQRHRQYLETSGELHERRKQRARDRICALVESMMQVDFWTDARKAQLEQAAHEVMDHTQTCHDAAHELLVKA